MKGIVIVNRFLTNLFSAGKATAITIFPFVFVLNKRHKADNVLLNHERIHLAQALEMLVIPFYLWYVLEFLIRYVQLRDADAAYLRISFEREAYGNERDGGYLRKRKFWTFIRYL